MKNYPVQNRSLRAPWPFERRPAVYQAPRINPCLKGFLAAARPDPDHFAYGLIANVHLLVSYHRDVEYRRYVQQAELVLPAGRMAAWLIRQLFGVRLPVCSPASVGQLLLQISRPTDRILSVGSTAVRDPRLQARTIHYRGQELAGCIDFIEDHAPFRFCLLTLSSPDRELVANEVLMRGRARGLALCMEPG